MWCWDKGLGLGSGHPREGETWECRYKPVLVAYGHGCVLPRGKDFILSMSHEQRIVSARTSWAQKE